MTDDDIIDLADKAGITFVTQSGVASATVEWLQKFASLVVEHERLAMRQWQGLTDEEIEMACWARVDKDLNVTHLDMDLCRNGEQNEYTALAIAIWDAATKAAQKEWQGLTADEIWQCNTTPPGSDVGYHICMAHQNVLDFAEAIEAKLKEKNT